MFDHYYKKQNGSNEQSKVAVLTHTASLTFSSELISYNGKSEGVNWYSFYFCLYPCNYRELLQDGL